MSKLAKEPNLANDVFQIGEGFKVSAESAVVAPPCPADELLDPNGPRLDKLRGLWHDLVINNRHNAAGNWIPVYGEILAEKNLLPATDWSVIHSPSGLICIHHDFVTIQTRREKLSEVDFYDVKDEDLDAELVKELCQSYLSEQKQTRSFHRSIYDESLALLRDETKLAVKNQFHGQWASFYDDGVDSLVLFCIPSHLDNPQLWKEVFQIPDTNWEMILPWAKVYESGLILASEVYVTHADGDHPDADGIPRGHDAFSYWALRGKKALPKNSPVSEMIKHGMTHTARHEGFHFIIDRFCSDLLRVSTNNCIYEGFPSALSPVREVELTDPPLSFNDFLNYPGKRDHNTTSPEESSRQYNANYVSGPRFFRALYASLGGEVGQNDVQLWGKIAAAMFEVAVRIGNLSAHSETEKVSEFLQQLILELGLELEVVKSFYESK